MTTTMKTNTKTKSLRCRVDGRVEAQLLRTAYTVQVDGGDVVVENVAAWKCPICAAVLAVPHDSTGRIAAALQEKAARAVQEVRVPVELEDLALGVNATLGTAGLSDPFTLPVHLGLQLIGDQQEPLPSWQRFDGFQKKTRARPRLHPDTRQRLEGLARLWETDVSSVIRWLTVLAADSMLAGLTTTMRDEEVFSETTTVIARPFAVYSNVERALTSASPASPARIDVTPALDLAA